MITRRTRAEIIAKKIERVRGIESETDRERERERERVIESMRERQGDKEREKKENNWNAIQIKIMNRQKSKRDLLMIK